MDITDTNYTTLRQASRTTRGDIEKNRRDVFGQRSEIALARTQSDGDGFFYDDDGEETGFWRSGMVPGALPIRTG